MKEVAAKLPCYLCGMPDDCCKQNACERKKRLGEPCPYCSGFGLKAYHPKDLCPTKYQPRQ